MKKKLVFSLLIGAILVLASCEGGSNNSGITETWVDSIVNSVPVHYPNATSIVIIHHTTEESSNSGNSSSESYSYPHLHSYSHPIYISHPVE